MNVYLVGGAVRDQLLQYPSIENDWVVVGSSPEQMTDKGYLPVGKDFPVFLHPETKEEYALARTERKTGKGYTGFAFHTDNSVTLEEDLGRRDLTINAIARDENGEFVDPYNGKDDIEKRILRHVSPAFAEDPVRVLRVARFAARYAHLGFVVADETTALMQSMVADGEVNHLVAERVWKEMSRALAERTPRVFIDVLKSCGALKVIIPELDRLFGVPQPPAHHPEIDTGLHSLLALQRAVKLSDAPEVRCAALLHDLGKGVTPQEEWPKHNGHEAKSADLIKTLAKRLRIPNEFKELSRITGEYHTHCHRAFELNPKTLLKVFKSTDAFRRPERFEEFLLCCQADAQGRTGMEETPYPQRQYFSSALTVARAITAQPLIEQGYSGQELGKQLHRAQLDALTAFKQNYKSTQAP